MYLTAAPWWWRGRMPIKELGQQIGLSWNGTPYQKPGQAEYCGTRHSSLWRKWPWNLSSDSRQAALSWRTDSGHVCFCLCVCFLGGVLHRAAPTDKWAPRTWFGAGPASSVELDLLPGLWLHWAGTALWGPDYLTWESTRLEQSMQTGSEVYTPCLSCLKAEDSSLCTSPRALQTMAVAHPCLSHSQDLSRVSQGWCRPLDSAWSVLSAPQLYVNYRQ